MVSVIGVKQGYSFDIGEKVSDNGSKSGSGAGTVGSF